MVGPLGRNPNSDEVRAERRAAEVAMVQRGQLQDLVAKEQDVGLSAEEATRKAAIEAEVTLDAKHLEQVAARVEDRQAGRAERVAARAAERERLRLEEAEDERPRRGG